MSGLFLGAALYAHAQIRLIKYENNNAVSGYELIEFTYLNNSGKIMTDTFDVVLHNPFNQLDYLKPVNLRNGEVFRLNKESLYKLQRDFGCLELTGEKSSRNLMWGYSNTIVKEDNGYVLISYNLFIEEEGVGRIGRGGRFASMIVLNHTGQIVYKLERLPMDAYNTTISEDGQFLAFAHGRGLYAYDGPNVQSGIQIWDLNNDTLFYEEDEFQQYMLSSIYGMIAISYYDNQKQMTKMLDIYTSNIYGPVRVSQYLGHLMVRQPDDTILQCEDLPLIK